MSTTLDIVLSLASHFCPCRPYGLSPDLQQQEEIKTLAASMGWHGKTAAAGGMHTTPFTLLQA